MRWENPIELGLEQLLDDSLCTASQFSGYSMCGVNLTNSHIADPYRELSTQQTSDFLAYYDTHHDVDFPEMDEEFDKIPTQIDSSVDASTLNWLPSYLRRQLLLRHARAPAYTVPRREPRLSKRQCSTVSRKKLECKPTGQSKFGPSGLLLETLGFFPTRDGSALDFAI